MNKTIVRRPKVDDSFLPNSLHPVVKQLYASRGVLTDKELALNLENLCPVSSLSGLEQACQQLYRSMCAEDNICIIGDFDCDGATSTAVMMQCLRQFGQQKLQYLVPNRFAYGYGLSPEIVEHAHRQGAKLLITVDNGISCIAGVDRANELGMKVIVTDHHLPGSELPKAAAIVNPNQVDCPFESKALAGVGVAFYFMLAMRKYLIEQQWFENLGIAAPNVANCLDLVALGTVADVVSLDNNNRILVEQGLRRIRAGHTRPGIQALIEVATRKQEELVASDFGFALGPRLNAAGRLDDMTHGIDCLLAPDLMTARALASELDALNKSRREIEQGMQLEAEQIFAKLNFAQNNLPHAIALYNENWHQGVIGIVAGRIKEKYYRPSIVFAKDENSNIIKGSARSIDGLHIRDLLEHIDTKFPDLIIKYGGHAMAAGLSIVEQDFEAFQQAFEQTAQKWLTPEKLSGKIESDGELQSQHLSIDFANLLKSSGPWGQHFPEPLFDDEFELVQQRIVGERHLKIVVSKDNKLYDAIAFNIDVKQWPNAAATKVHLAFRLDVNEFRGNKSLQFIVENIEVANSAH